MKAIIDLHIHSRFSRACSKDLTIQNLAVWAARKGIDILGTGDFTHPKWLEEIENELEEREPGLYMLKNGKSQTRFLLTTEISCIYKQDGRVRRVHNLVCASSLSSVKKIISALEAQKCNLKSDGRPIIGLSSKDLLSLVLLADPKCLFIPAHAWTPWFSVFGSASGFDSLEECFGKDLEKEIHAIETGLSSDPQMNWRISSLDKVMLVSNSDAHSLRNLGREANQMNLREWSFEAFAEILRNKDCKRFLQTLEFFPEEGKYHTDGHRSCGVRLTPSETKRLDGKCPVCDKQVTVGVLNRIDDLADRAVDVMSPVGVPFKHIIPLEEIIAEAFGMKKGGKKVLGMYMKMTDIASEFTLLLDYPLRELLGVIPPHVIEGIRRVREEDVSVVPGYDGEFGVIKIFEDVERK